MDRRMCDPLKQYPVHCKAMREEIAASDRLRDKQRVKARSLEALRQKDPTNIQKIVRGRPWSGGGVLDSCDAPSHAGGGDSICSLVSGRKQHIWSWLP
jgi:hypothetical protein